jgi:hypothetical protein
VYPLQSEAGGLLNGIGALPFSHWMSLLVLALLVLAVVFVNGVRFRLGPHEIAIRGLSRDMEDWDHDFHLSMELQKTAAGIDSDIQADLWDLTESTEEKVYDAHKGICYFPAQRFAEIVRKELYKRIGRNNLKSRLALDRRQAYVSEIKKTIRDKYKYFLEMIRSAACGEVYPEYDALRGFINLIVDQWAGQVAGIVINGCRRKIGMYAAMKKQFKLEKLRERYCLNKIRDNIGYIRDLGGVYEEGRAV